MKAIWITVFCGYSLVVFGQTVTHISLNPKPHSIYGLCIINEDAEFDEVEFPDIEIDSGIFALKFDIKVLKGQGGNSTKWVKRKADENCLSQNPDDCLVWCLVEVLLDKYELAETYEDLSDNSDFFSVNVGDEESLLDWQPIVWFEDLEYKEQKRIIKKLKRKKYLDKKHEVEWSSDVIAALHQFQRDRQLPIGNLNFLTLDKLNIHY